MVFHSSRMMQQHPPLWMVRVWGFYYLGYGLGSIGWSLRGLWRLVRAEEEDDARHNKRAEDALYYEETMALLRRDHKALEELAAIRGTLLRAPLPRYKRFWRMMRIEFRWPQRKPKRKEP